jgi:hypothetical protein
MSESTTSKASAKSKNEKLKEKIRQAYIEHRLISGGVPGSVFAFCKDLKIKESEFYQHYNSFLQIEQDFWKDKMHITKERLHDSSEWEEFSTREKLLAFYFTWFEEVLEDRSFSLKSFPSKPAGPFSDDPLQELKKEFDTFIKELLIEGESKGEIASRGPISARYSDLLWMQFMFLFNYWRKDSSQGFEQTDAAIEKSVNLGFDLMGKGVVESLFDFGKFLLKQN